MDGWMGGWMDGWMDVKAVIRIAYSNQKTEKDCSVGSMLVCRSRVPVQTLGKERTYTD